MNDAAVPSSLVPLFYLHPICNPEDMGSISLWLLDSEHPGGDAGHGVHSKGALDGFIANWKLAQWDLPKPAGSNPINVRCLGCH